MEPIRELIAVDLEMTGLQVKTDRILEIGAVRLVDGQLRDTFQTFVNPHRRIDARITELTVGDGEGCSGGRGGFAKISGVCWRGAISWT